MTTILVLILFQLPLAGWLGLVPEKGVAALLGGEGIFWVLTLILLAYILLVERRPLSSIGLKMPTPKTAAFGLAAGVVMIAGSAIIYMFIFPEFGLPAGETSMAALQSIPRWFQLLVVVRAAVFEEIYYRGFAIERLAEITGRRWLAALISLAAFTQAHLNYWGWAHLIIVAFAGGVLTGLYLLRRDLGANMIAHLATDVAGFLLQ